MRPQTRRRGVFILLRSGICFLWQFSFLARLASRGALRKKGRRFDLFQKKKKKKEESWDATIMIFFVCGLFLTHIPPTTARSCERGRLSRSRWRPFATPFANRASDVVPEKSEHGHDENECRYDTQYQLGVPHCFCVFFLRHLVFFSLIVVQKKTWRENSMSDFTDAVTNTDDVDEYDTLLDMLDLLEHQPSSGVGLAAAKLAERYMDCILDLSVNERALLTTAIEKKMTSAGADSALVAFKSLYLRVRGRAHDN
jgi:hypothetical protein